VGSAIDIADEDGFIQLGLGHFIHSFGRKTRPDSEEGPPRRGALGKHGP
jgi:hypothetical protein